MEIQLNFVDKTIDFFSPKLGAERLKMRAANAFATEQVRKYNGAAMTRRTQGWNAGPSSANTEIALALPILRARSRELVQNNPYAKRAIQAITTNTVGVGIMPAPEGLKGPEMDTFKKYWLGWAQSTDCDFYGQLDFYGLQALVMRTVAKSGEALIIRRRRTGLIPIQLQVVEGDYLDFAKNDLNIKGNEGWIMQGVQFDKNGKRVGYWLFDSHPAEGMAYESKFVKASEVLHVYEIERPGQVRGVPMGSASMLRLKDFDDFEDAQLQQQKIAACFVGFVTKVGGDAMNSQKSELADRVAPGMIYELGVGEDVKFGTPPTTQGSAEYAKTTLRGVAAGYGPTYESVTGDLSNVNFSSGRMGWLEFQRLVQHWQNNMLVPMLCNPVFSWFTDALALGGGMKKGAKISAQWTPPRREMIQPKEEIEALVMQVRAGLKSWQEAVRELGLSPETVLAELTDEQKKFDANGLILEVDARHNLQQNISSENGKIPAATAKKKK
jgi:lambda family phage portal protein